MMFRCLVKCRDIVKIGEGELSSDTGKDDIRGALRSWFIAEFRNLHNDSVNSVAQD